MRFCSGTRAVVVVVGGGVDGNAGIDGCVAGDGLPVGVEAS